MLAKRCNPRCITVIRMYPDAPDVLTLQQTKMLPAFPCINGFVHAVTLHDVAAKLSFTSPDIHYVGIGFTDGHSTDRGRIDLAVSHWSPCGATISGLPQATTNGSEVVFERTCFTSSHSCGATSPWDTGVLPGEHIEEALFELLRIQL